MNYQNKVVLITGASTGIGKATAIEFAKLGSNLVLVSRRKEKLLELQKSLESFTNNVLSFPCDVSQNNQVETLKDEVIKKFGTVDILINNAGFGIFSKVIDSELDSIEKQMQTNYFGMVYCVKNFLPYMLPKKSGHIVNVASLAASFGLPGMASYCASKFAMLGFSESLKFELKGSGVGITVVSPIMVKTNFFDHASFSKFKPNAFSLNSETVAKAIVKASRSSRAEIIVPSVARIAVWTKHNFPFVTNFIISNGSKRYLF